MILDPEPLLALVGSINNIPTENLQLSARVRRGNHDPYWTVVIQRVDALDDYLHSGTDKNFEVALGILVRSVRSRAQQLQHLQQLMDKQIADQIPSLFAANNG